VVRAVRRATTVLLENCEQDSVLGRNRKLVVFGLEVRENKQDTVQWEMEYADILIEEHVFVSLYQIYVC